MSVLKIVCRTLILYACAIAAGLLCRLPREHGIVLLPVALIGWLLSSIVLWRYVVLPTWRWFWPQRSPLQAHCTMCDRNEVYIDLVFGELARRYAKPAVLARERVSPRRSP